METTDTSEKGLESLIMRHMTCGDGLSVPANQVAFAPPPFGCTGYYADSAKDCERAHGARSGAEQSDEYFA